MTGERILVVDDSKENREFIIEYILTPNHYEAIEARDGLEGMECARRLQPDLMLLDLEMPRLNGRGVLEALRREGLAIPVILMTFHGSEEVAIEVFRLGVRDYVKKPYTPEELLACIEAALTETRLRREKDALTNRLLNANRELNTRVKELNTLYTIGKSVTTQLNPVLLLPRIVEAAANLTKAEQASLYLIEGERLVRRAFLPRGEAHAHPAAEICQDRFAERAAATGKPFAVPPVELGNDVNSPTAVAAVPLKVADQVIGVLTVESFAVSRRGFTEHDGALLSTLADYAAIAIENAQYQSADQMRGREPTSVRTTSVDPIAPTRREVSVLFAELRGYNSMSEKADPETVVALLNRYLALAAEAITAHQGTLGGYTGQGVMALFNAQYDQFDHVRQAVDAALALQAAVADFNSMNQSNLQFSVGINLGEAILGNVGAAQTLAYTAIGDTVNLAKRLQERADAGQIFVEEGVIRQLGDSVKADRLGEMQVKGRKFPAVVYVLKG
ncbi:MAG TPA: adenylate/guanylate cyclase domain-containing protein [Aggregatilineaceae bacterium]|nr:adenylate/guanylate cyclase domain-containing protein [Aggregatilineaceae bacterium]